MGITARHSTAWTGWTLNERTLNRQVLGSSPRGRTHKGPGQDSTHRTFEEDGSVVKQPTIRNGMTVYEW